MFAIYAKPVITTVGYCTGLLGFKTVDIMNDSMGEFQSGVFLPFL
jgi:hypothetical protein